MEEFLNIPVSLGLKILNSILIIILALILLRLTSFFRHRIEKKLSTTTRPKQNTDQLKTFITVLDYIIRITIIFLGVAMILMVFGVNLAPLLATVGIAGLAVTLGAQTIFRDYVGGLIIIAENLFFVGDKISVGTVIGTVETVTLRATYLRNHEGNLVIIPNGDIRTFTRENTNWIISTIDLVIPYDLYDEKKIDELRTTLMNWRENDLLSNRLLEDPQLSDSLKEDGSILIQVKFKTTHQNKMPTVDVLRKLAFETMPSIYPNQDDSNQ